MAELTPASRIGLRNDSMTGGRTIDIFPVGGKMYKIHVEPIKK